MITVEASSGSGTPQEAGVPRVEFEGVSDRGGQSEVVVHEVVFQGLREIPFVVGVEDVVEALDGLGQGLREFHACQLCCVHGSAL